MPVEKPALKYLKFLALITASALLSVTTVVLGALPLLVARRMSRRSVFWITQLAIAAGITMAGLPFYGLIILAQTLAIGVYVEVEDHRGSVFTSGFVSILASIGAAVVVGGVWLMSSKLRLGELLREQIDPLVEQLASVNSGNHMLSTESLIQQLSSASVIALVLALACALMGEKRLSSIFKINDYKAGDRESLVAFRLPDSFVWAVVVAIAGAFLKHGLPLFELISVNLLNVLVVLYFFQGLAVVAQAFRTFKVSGVWQAIWYVLIVLQLFLLVSLIGFADYWLEFRVRLTRKPAETNRGF